MKILIYFVFTRECYQNNVNENCGKHQLHNFFLSFYRSRWKENIFKILIQIRTKVCRSGCTHNESDFKVRDQKIDYAQKYYKVRRHILKVYTKIIQSADFWSNVCRLKCLSYYFKPLPYKSILFYLEQALLFRRRKKSYFAIAVFLISLFKAFLPCQTNLSYLHKAARLNGESERFGSFYSEDQLSHVLTCAIKNLAE